MVIGDAANSAVLEEALNGVDYVICAAGGLLPPEAQERPAADATATLLPLLSLLEALRKRATVGLTYLSSGGTVYGNPLGLTARETDPVAPISAYGVSRAAAEMYVQMYGRTHGFPVQIVRCANVYGPGQPAERSQGAVAVFLHRVAAGLPLRIVGDGSAVRDYVYVGDVADAIARLVLGQHDTGIVNVGAGRGHTVLEVVEHVSNVVGRPAILEFLPPRPHDVRAIVLDIAKLTALIDYAPLSLSAGLRRSWPPPALEAAAADAVRATDVVADPLGLDRGSAVS
jgi:UDP-glucose 4-epimerase